MGQRQVTFASLLASAGYKPNLVAAPRPHRDDVVGAGLTSDLYPRWTHPRLLNQLPRRYDAVEFVFLAPHVHLGPIS